MEFARRARNIPATITSGPSHQAPRRSGAHRSKHGARLVGLCLVLYMARPLRPIWRRREDVRGKFGPWRQLFRACPATRLNERRKKPIGGDQTVAGRGEKSLLCDHRSELRVGRRERERRKCAKMMNGIRKKKTRTKNSDVGRIYLYTRVAGGEEPLNNYLAEYMIYVYIHYVEQVTLVLLAMNFRTNVYWYCIRWQSP